MELLIQASRVHATVAEPLALVPFLFIEDKEGSTMSSTDEAAGKSFHTMLKEMIKIHERCFADAKLEPEEQEWIQFYRDLDLAGYVKVIRGFTAKLGPTPAEALDYQFDVAEAKAFAAAE